jgi:hypothetical protein
MTSDEILMKELSFYCDNELTTKVIHKKTGNIYYILGESCINCTNDADHQVMIQYAVPSLLKKFVREQTEFWEKFEKV